MAPAIPDSTLIERSLDDAGAFTDIFDRYFPEIHGFVTRRIGAPIAEDVAAEVFLVAFRRRADFDRSKADIRPWLYGIAVNLIGSHKRTERRGYRAFAKFGADPALDKTADIDERIIASSSRAELAAGLAALKPGDRDVLLLHAWGELDHAAIAEALGLPVGTVKSRLARARKGVAAHLTSQSQTTNEVPVPKEA